MSDDEKRRFYELAQKDAERYQAEVVSCFIRPFVVILIFVDRLRHMAVKI